METFNAEPLWGNPTIGFAGDWHGNRPWATNALHVLADQGVSIVYQLGDFGLWGGPNGADYRKKLQRVLDERDLLVLVVPGNHENYDMLETFPRNEGGWQVSNKQSRIWYAPRGHLWTHQHVRFAALGGAGSIDRNLRTEGVSWWPQEEITRLDVQRLQDNMQAAEWDRVDVFLSHDAPAGVYLPTSIRAPWLTRDVEDYCNRQRVLLREAVDHASPEWLFHGHWHRTVRADLSGVTADGEDYACKVVGLPEDGTFGNLVKGTLLPIMGLASIDPVNPHRAS